MEGAEQRLSTRSVDERVVQMQFDNQKFERNVQTSLGTLDKLKSALDFDKSAKSLQGLEKTANSFNLDVLAQNIQSIADRFSTFGIVGDQVIRRITDGFLGLANSVKKTVKELTLDQVTAGWNKYADKTSAVQTIMAATAKDFTDTGEQMDYVNGQLEKLNWFTDETSYNFLDMVSNIGKFTSNNIKLDQAVTSMQGISTWAAISGANTQEASRAMYNLSQAIAVGSVKLMDWKSIENANMATADFKQTAIDTAVELGTLTKVGDGLYKTMKGNEVSVSNFNQALSDSWFSSEVLLKSLDKYGGFADKLYDASQATNMTATELLQAVDKYKAGSLDIGKIADESGKSVEELDAMFKELSSDTFALGQRSFRAAQEAKTFKEAIDSVKDAVSTGWMNSFELIFGNYEEAKNLWTNVANGLYDIFAAGAEGRNDLLREWHNASSEDGTYYDSFALSITNMLDGLVAVKELVGDVFGDILPNVDLTTLTTLTDKFKTASTNFKNFFDTERIEQWESDLESAQKIAGDEYITDSGTRYTAASLRALEDRINKIHNFQDALSGAAHLLDIVRKGFQTLSNSLAPVGKIFSSLTNGAVKIGGALGRLLGHLDAAYTVTDGFRGVVDKLATSISKLIDSGATKLSDFIDQITGKKFTDVVGGISPKVKKLSESIGILGGESHTIRDAIMEVDKHFGNFAGKEKDIFKVSEAFGKFADKASEARNKISEAFGKIDLNKYKEDFKNTFKGIESVFSLIGKAISGIINLLPSAISLFGKMFGWVLSATGAIGKFVTSVDEGTESTSFFSGAIDFLKTVLEKIGEILSPITDKIKELFDSMASGNFEGFKNLMKGALSGGLLTGILKLVNGFTKITDSIGSDKKGLLGILDTLKTTFLDTFSSIQDTLHAKKLTSIAAAVGILSASLLLLSTIDQDSLGTGLMGISVLFAELLGFLKGLTVVAGGNGLRSISSLSSVLIKISGAIAIFALSLKLLSTIKMEDLASALIGMGATFAEISGFLFALQKIGGGKGIKGIKQISSVMKSIASAMLILSVSAKIFSTMSWEGIAKGIVAIGAIIAEITGFIAALSAVQKAMGKAGFFGISVVIMTIAGAITVLTVAMLALSLLSWESIAKGIVAIGGLFAIISGFAAISGGIIPGLLAGAAALAVVAPALVIMAGAMAILGGMSWGGIGKAIVAMAGGLLTLAIGLTAMIVALPGAFALTVAAKALLLLTAPMAIIGAMPVGTIAKALITFAIGLGILIAAGVGLTAVSAGLLAGAAAMLAFGAAAALFGAGIALIGAGLTSLAVSGAAGATAFVLALETIVVGIGDIASGAVESIAKVVVAVVDAIVLAIPSVLNGIGVVVVSVLGFLIEKTPEIVGLLVDLLVTILNTIGERMPDLIDAGINLMVSFINGMADGIRDNTDKILGAINNLMSSIIEFAISVLQELVRQIPIIGGEMADGLELLKKDVHNRLAPEEARKTANDAGNGMAKGLRDSKPEVRKAGIELGDDALFGLNDAIPKITDAGSGSASAYLDGFSIGGKNASSTTSKIADAAIAGLGSGKSAAESVGSDYVRGFAKGLWARKWEVDEAAEAVGNSVIKRTRNTLQIQSPSKVGEEIGMYWDMGWAQGISKYSNIIERASDEVSNTPVNSMRSALDRLSDMVENDIDTDPVIRPVMDLSQIEASTREMNSMFDNQNRIASRIPHFATRGEVDSNTKNYNYGGINVNITQRKGEDTDALVRRAIDALTIDMERERSRLA